MKERPIPVTKIAGIAVALAVITVVVYTPSGNNDFTGYDDPLYVTENYHVLTGLTWENVKWAFTTNHAANWHPITWLSHQLDVTLFGESAKAHHYVNVGWHGLNTALLFLVLMYMTGALWPSAFVAVLFALHPLHVESVAWIAERKDVLSTFFGIAAIGAYAWYVRTRKVGRYVLVAVLLALGLMAKPMLVTFPFVFLLLDYWPLNRLEGKDKQIEWRRAGRLALEKLPLIALAVASSVVTLLVQRSGGAVSELDVVPISLRITNAITAYAMYLVHTVWPMNLAVLYPLPLDGIAFWKWGISLAFLIAATAFALALYKKAPYVTIGWLFYLGTLVPVIGIVQVGMQSMADRYTYVPLIGIFILIAWGVRTLVERWDLPRLAPVAGAAVVIALCAAGTLRQQFYWQNDLTLFARTLQVTENNPVAHNNLGQALNRNERPEEAAAQFQAALELDPDYASAFRGMGNALSRLNRREEAVQYFAKALQIDPEDASTHINTGMTLAEMGQFDKAESALRKAVQLDPMSAEAHNNLGATLAMQGKLDAAVPHFAEALRLKPGYGSAMQNLQRAAQAKKQAGS